MDEEDGERVQTAFRDGEFVPVESAAGAEREPVAPRESADAAFVLAVTDDALAVNDALADVADEDRTLGFESRDEAETYAAQLAVGDGALRVQAAAPNDPRDCDAYLLAAHDPAVAEPAEADGDGRLTFDVGANAYGTLGEALLFDVPKRPALRYVVREDLGLDDERAAGISLDVERGETLAVPDPEGDDIHRWVPDCVLTVRDGRDGPGDEALARYYCEVKTGDGSFQRAQPAAMRALAAEERVLKVRVRVDDLPEQYTVYVDEVDPATGE
jgi:hypothetical protein